jgi:hypothetical protein
MTDANDARVRSAQAEPRPFALDVTLGVFLACMVALSAPWTTGHYALPWDAAAHFYPQFVFLSDAFHAGDSPFWNPHVFAGHPQIADPQSLIFAPLFLALAAFVKSPSLATFGAAVFAHLAMGGVGMILYARDRRWSEPAALIAALAFAFGGAAIWRVQHVGQVMSLSWLPLALWAWARGLERMSFRWGVAAGVFAGLMALGRDQVALLGLWTLVGYTAARWLSPFERARFSVAPLFGGALAGALIVAVPVMMSASFAAASNRPQIDFEGAGKGSLHPASLLSFFVANLFGVDGPLAQFWGPPSGAWGPTDLYLARNMTALYQGALTALLVVGAVFRNVWRDGAARFAAVGLILATLYALGRYTPFYAAIFHIPGADLFRRPADATFLIGFFVALLAGAVADRWIKAPPRSGRVAATLVTAVLLGLAALMWRLAQEKGATPLAGRALASAAVAYVLAAAALYLARRAWRRGAFAALLVVALFSMADLGFHNGPSESTALPPATYAALDPNRADPLVAALDARLVQNAAPDRRDRVELAAIDFHWPNVSMTRRWDNDLGYNPLRMALFTRATGAGDHLALASQRQWSSAWASYRSPMSDLIGLRWIVSAAPLSALDHAISDTGLPAAAKIGDATIYDRGAPTPRVVLATAALGVDFERLLEDGRWPAFDPRRVVLLDLKDAPAQTTQQSTSQGAARIVAYRNAEVIVETDAPVAGWLVLHDVDHPWWRVEVDGADAPILRANLMFRAVAVPPGAHRVRFVFRPFAGLAQDVATGALARLDALVALVDRGLGGHTPAPAPAPVPEPPPRPAP